MDAEEILMRLGGDPIEDQGRRGVAIGSDEVAMLAKIAANALNALARIANEEMGDEHPQDIAEREHEQAIAAMNGLQSANKAISFFKQLENEDSATEVTDEKIEEAMNDAMNAFKQAFKREREADERAQDN